LTINLNIFKDSVKEMKIRLLEFKVEDCVEIYRNHFSELIQLHQEQIEDSRFTKFQYNEIIRYLGLGMSTNFNLFRFVFCNAQESDTTHVSRPIEPPTISYLPLNTAIRGENWDQYCKYEQDRKDAELKSLENKRIAALEVQQELKEQEIAERKTASLLERLRTSKIDTNA
jgi:hypothetical protein